MEPTEIIAGIDYGVKLLTLLINSSGAQDEVGAIVAKRVAEGGRDWTEAERRQVLDSVQMKKAYAVAEANKPDPVL